MNQLYHRQFDVDYFEKDADIWVVAAHLVDEMHDITTEVEVAVPNFVVRDARVKFDRAPFEECKLVKQACSRLIGMEVRKDFGRKAREIFVGPEGCPNVMNLLFISLPPLEFYYPWEQAKRGVPVKRFDSCLAHTVRDRNEEQPQRLG